MIKDSTEAERGRGAGARPAKETGNLLHSFILFPYPLVPKLRVMKVIGCHIGYHRVRQGDTQLIVESLIFIQFCRFYPQDSLFTIISHTHTNNNPVRKVKLIN